MKGNNFRELASKFNEMADMYNEMADKVDNNELTKEMEDMYIGKSLRIANEINDI